MGEIRIKSGNLYPILIGEDTWNNLNDTTHSNNNGELIVVMGTVENSGVYSPSGSTIRTVHKDLSTYSWSVEIKADSPASLVIGFEGDGVKYFNITSKYQKLTFNNQSFISDKAFVMYNRTGVTRTVYLRNFMLNEGSTALSYQPYFLNKPAHQYVNGEWIDIPTHHYTNGRWQGELTSQSPLEFRATGQSLLDWRIDGALGGVGDWDEGEQKYKIPVRVEGKNLWDGTFVNTSGWGVSFSLDDEGYMVASSRNDPRGWGYVASQIKMTLGAGTYSLVLQGIAPTQNWSGAMIHTSAGSALAHNQNLVNKPLIIMPFTLTQETSIGIMVKVVDGKYKVQLLKGTYTSSTVPPYEVNLYTDHQLMDGDSLDYTTDQTSIPITQGDNTLTVGTAVQPSKVFVKFEG